MGRLQLWPLPASWRRKGCQVSGGRAFAGRILTVPGEGCALPGGAVANTTSQTALKSSGILYVTQILPKPFDLEFFLNLFLACLLWCIYPFIIELNVND